MKHPSKIIPWLFLIGISAVPIILAKTYLLQPLMQFIHTDQVSTWQVTACIIFSIVGLWLTFTLLNIICNFYADKFDQIPGNSAGIISSHSTDHGGETN